MSTRRVSHRKHDDTPRTDDAFARLAALPDGVERAALREEVVRAWLPLSQRLAGRYRDRGEAVEDLRQIAAVGLLKAVDGFDPAHGTAFLAYATPTITGEIKRHFRDHMWAVHVPRRVQELRTRVREARLELQATGTIEPGEPEIARHTGLSEDEVRTGMEALDSFCALSLDAEQSGTEGSCTLGGALGADDPALDTLVDRESVKPALHALPARERRIPYLRYFRGMTQKSIGRELGISQMHVCRLLRQCCADLRDEATCPAREEGV
ncbi:SigB/SigF/SigG family RNA polymerase sigma factor [Streptomyces sp. NPDC059070]|uniref:SigB/SigF/SigG family RNA polymerase sigma factor n=1 Tax=Streptomyces sp. NPDC059070 TaxID=3346713 RepID=UPI00368BD312